MCAAANPVKSTAFNQKFFVENWPAKKKRPLKSGVFLSKTILLILSKIWVRSRNSIRSFFTFICCAYVNCIAIAAFFTIFEDKTITTNTLFFDQVVDNGIYSIPASLLLNFVAGAISGYYHVATWRVTHAISNYCQQSLRVITQFN